MIDFRLPSRSNSAVATLCAAACLALSGVLATPAQARLGGQVQSGGYDHSYRVEGTTHWFELRKGDGDSAKRTRGITDRSELRLTYPGTNDSIIAKPGEETWFSFSFAMRYDRAPDDWVSIFQFLPTRDKADTAPKSPALAFELDGRDLKVVTRTDAKRSTVRNPRLTQRVRLRNMPVSGLDEATIFHDVVGRVVFGWDNDAELEVWVNGHKVISHSGINIGYNDPRGPYAKAGLYRAASSDTLQMVLRDPQVSLSRPLMRR